MNLRLQKDARGSLFPLALLSVVIGAFIVGSVVYAVDVLTPPTAMFPDNGSLPEIGGGGGNLLQILKGTTDVAAQPVAGASYAKWGDFKENTLIGGRLGLGQVVMKSASVGAQTITGPRIEYPLDIQVDYLNEISSPNDIWGNVDKHNTAIIRLSGQDQTNSAYGQRIWTGLQLARMDTSNTTRPFAEKWFVGMDNSTDHFIIRSTKPSATQSEVNDPSKDIKQNIVDIDPDKGAACFGAMYNALSANPSDGRPGAGGYKEANKKCAQNAHVCTVEEILRTITCQPDLSIFADSTPAVTAWISKGSTGYTQLASNDCVGWTQNVDTVKGAIWVFKANGGFSSLSGCNTSTRKFACCK